MIERYSHPEMARVWSIENKLDQWQAVEIAVAEAWASVGVVPADVLPAIRRARYNLPRMREIEERTRHDVTAFLRSMTEHMGDEGRFIHLGLTSSDVVDTGLSLQVVEAGALIHQDLDLLEAALIRRALEFKDTLTVGRTHGVHAEPTTFGFKLAGWIDEVRRNRDRLAAATEQMRYGKISGAVGTHANVPPNVEEKVCHALGLHVAPVSTQILQRDRHAHFITTLAVIAGSLEKFATEIRALQRTEIHEVEEPFASGQQGSSAMPHKRNPELAERICGQARVIRGNALTALEAQALWHERDISNSSAERLIFPESCLLADYAIRLMTRIIDGMVVFPERMRRNLELTHGLVFSQRVLLALIEQGASRTDAYDAVQHCAMECWRTDESFQRILERDPIVQRYLNTTELESLFDYAYYVRFVDDAFRRLDLIPASSPAEVNG